MEMVIARGEFTVAELHDGVPEKFYRAWANSANGATSFSKTDSSNRSYLGTYVGLEEPSSYSQYNWSLIKGADGVSVISMVEEYYYSTSSTTQTGGSWSTTYPSWVSGKYLWLRIKTNYSSGNPTYTKAMNVTGQSGSDGNNNFTWVKYADDEKGNGMADVGAGKMFLGIAINKTTAKESEIATDYQWSPMYDLEALDGISLRDKTEILSGNPAFTDKSDDAVVHVGVDGKSEQVIIEGNVNILPDKGIYTSTASASSTHTYATFPAEMEMNQEYTFSANIEKLVGTFTQVTLYAYPSGFLSTVNIPSSGDVSFTFTKNNVNTVNILVYAGVAGSTNGNSIRITKYKLEKGSVVTPNPTPSPDYPSAINSLDKSFDIVSSVGKENLLKRTGWNGYANYNTTPTVDGNVISFKRVDGTGGRLAIQQAKPLPYGGDVVYTISGIMKINGNPVTNNEWLYKGASTYQGTVLRFDLDDSTGKFIITQKWTSGSGWIFHGSNMAKGAVGDIITIEDFQIESGIDNTPYSQNPDEISYDTLADRIYKTNILLSEPLRSVGDVKDRLFLDTDGLWKVERNVREYTITGNENWTAEGSFLSINNYAYIGTSNLKSGGVISSNLLPEGTFRSQSNENIDTTSVIILTLSNTRTGVVSSDTVSQRSAKFKTWVTANPMTVQYELATPTIETLSAEQQTKLNNIQSFKGSNYVYTMANVEPNLNARFKSIGWYDKWKTEKELKDVTDSLNDLEDITLPALSDGLLNKAEKESIKQSLNLIESEKKGLDSQYNSIYLNANLTGAPKANLYNAKAIYNTAQTDLKVAINAVLSVADNVRINATLITKVEIEFRAYGDIFATLKTRFEEALDAISGKKVENVNEEVDRVAQRVSVAESKITDSAITNVVMSSTKYTGDIAARPTKTEAQGYASTAESNAKSHANTEVGKVVSRVAAAEQKITDTAITSTVMSSTQYRNDLTGKVSTNEIISRINQTAEEIQIEAKNVNFKGAITFSSFDNETKSDIDSKSTKTEAQSYADAAQTNAEKNAKEAADAVATAKSNLAEVAAKAYADGKVSEEEARAISDANAKLVAAKTHADTKAAEVKAIADKKSDQIEIMGGTPGKIFKNPVSFNSSTNVVTGCLVIKTPIKSPFMTKVSIAGYNYTGTTTSIDLDISFYAYTASQFVNFSYVNKGNYPVNKVRLARNSAGEAIIIIGDETSVWSYPKIQVTQAIIAQSTPPDSYQNGWSIEYLSVLTGLTAITNVVGSDYIKEIKDVTDTATGLKNFTDTAFSDGIIQRAEAQAISEHLNMLRKENDDLSNQYLSINGNNNLIGTPKTNLASAKTAYNTAYTNLVNTINTAISGDKTTAAQKTDVDAKFTAYSNALKLLTQRLSESQTVISEKIANELAGAKANLAEVNAKAHADGKITAEEKRAIADAKAKLVEAQGYADNAVGAIEVGSRNYLLNTRTDISVNGAGISNQVGKELNYNFSSTPNKRLNQLPLIVGEKWTVIFDYELIAITPGGSMILQFNDSPYSVGLPAINLSNNPSGHVEYTMTVNSSWLTSTATELGFRLDGVNTGHTFKVKNMALVKGNKGTYSPAPEDINADIAQAQTEATNAKNSADVSTKLLADLSNDSILTPVEKKSVKKEWDIIGGEKNKITDEATSYGITGEKNAYITQYNNLQTYIEPKLANLNANSDIGGSTFRAYFKNYYDARQDVLNAITSKVRFLADKAQEAFDGLEIGGGNLLPLSSLRDSKSFSSFNSSDVAASLVNGQYTLLNRTSASVNRAMFSQGKKIDMVNEFNLGDSITISLDVYVESLAVNGSTAFVRWNNSSGGMISDASVAISTTTPKGQWVRISETSVIPSTADLSRTASLAIGIQGVAKIRVRNLQVVKGNKTTSWTPSVSDVDDMISEAQAAADSARASIADMSSDSKITPVEKVQLKKEWATIASERTSLDGLAGTYGLGAEKTNMTNAYNTLSSALNGTNGILANMTTTSTVVGSVFRSQFDDYYEKKAILQKKVSEIARVLANGAQGTADTVKGVVTNFDSAIINANPIFLDWTAQFPAGYSGITSSAGSGVSKAVSNNGMGNALKYTVLAGSTGVFLNPFTVTTAPFYEYATVEFTFKLESGTIDGAGVLFRYTGNGNTDHRIHIKDSISSPTLNKWYTVTKTIKQSSIPAGFTGYQVYPMAGWTTFGSTITAKVIQYDSLKSRQATEQEINAYESNIMISDMSSDSKITPVEKVQLKKEWATIAAERTSLDGLASAYIIGAERTNLTNAYNNLYTVLHTTNGGIIGNMSTTTTIVGSTFRAQFDDYYEKKAILQRKVSEVGKAIADSKLTAGEVTEAILSDKSIKDTRSSNETPLWYIANYPKQEIREFKYRGTIGVPGKSTYVQLTTKVPWAGGTSGGVPVQVAESNDGTYQRVSNSSGSAWLAWTKMDLESKINNAVVSIDETGINVKDGSFFLEDDTTDTRYSIVSKENLIKDHSFEEVTNFNDNAYNEAMLSFPVIQENLTAQESAWSAVGSPYIHNGNGRQYVLNNKEVLLSQFGYQSATVNSANYFKQTTIPVRRGSAYTLTAFFKNHMNLATGGIPAFVVNLVTAKGETISVGTKSFTALNSKNTDVSSRRSYTFTVPGTSYDTSVFLEIHIKSANGNWVNVDGVQLVEGSYPVVYNVDESSNKIINLPTVKSFRLLRNTNLNTLFQEGNFFAQRDVDATTMLNTPSNLAFSLNIERHAGWKQTLTNYQSGNPKTWVRNYYYSSGWGEWKVIVGSPEWIGISKKNGWSNYGGVYGTPSYFKDANNIVHLRGMTDGGSQVANSVMGTLPVGYRPENRELFVCNGYGLDFIRVDVEQNGNITFSTKPQGWVSLSGISFLGV